MIILFSLWVFSWLLLLASTLIILFFFLVFTLQLPNAHRKAQKSTSICVFLAMVRMDDFFVDDLLVNQK